MKKKQSTKKIKKAYKFKTCKEHQGVAATLDCEACAYRVRELNKIFSGALR